MVSEEIVRSLLPEKFRFVNLIMEGTYGRVDLIKNKETEGSYVAKTIMNRNFREIEKTLIEESSFNHPNIVRGISSQNNEKFHQLIFEYCPHGDLFDCFQKGWFSEMKQIISIAGQVAKALMFCHSQGIIHGDVKPENILIDRTDPIHIKLADFGLSFTLPYSKSGSQGTYEFMSPEMISNSRSQISFPTDIWSFGVMIYEMVYWKTPFGCREDSKAVLQKRICHPNISYPAEYPVAKDFFSKIFIVEPRARMTAKQCLEHPFLKAWYRADMVKDFIKKNHTSQEVYQLK